MISERENEYRFGKSWISQYLVASIDTVLITPETKAREILSKNYANMLIAQLATDNVSFDILEHLKIEFIKAKKDNDSPNGNEVLRPIEEILITEFGHEVTRRVNLSISDNKIRTLAH